jgi:DNA-binding response OmpR family regulator
MHKTKLLVADDDVFFQNLIERLLAPCYDLVIVQDGLEAWHELQAPDAPRLAILDWVMPGLSGPQICRKVRASEDTASKYLILLTAKNNESDIIAGLRSGADDYITKPPLPAELRARITMGERVLALQDTARMQEMTARARSGPQAEPVAANGDCKLSVETPLIEDPSYECGPNPVQQPRVLLRLQGNLQEGRHSNH